VTRATRVVLIVLLFLAPARQVWAQPSALLVWGCDPEGGAPYVEADPSDPSRQVGFEVDIATLVAAHLHRQATFSFVAFSSINQSLRRGDFEVSFCGLEEITARRTGMAATIPYYQFHEVLTVRAGDKDRFRSLEDLRGRSVATLAATQAFELLKGAEPRYGLTAVSYEDDVHPYDDLVLGRVDAVLLDNVLAGREHMRRSGIVTQPRPVDVGYYVGVLAPSNLALREEMNQALLAAMKDGRLEAIFRKWGLWNDDQTAFYARVLAEHQTSLPGHPIQMTAGGGWQQAVRNYLPTLLTASLVTIGLSCTSMALAIAVGVLIATGRVYGRWPLRTALKAYVELTRGTPVLLQLFVLYYGLASVIRLPAMFAAFLGLGLNYAAYESEIYRGALEAVSRGQLEAARTLGLSERQVLRLVRGPQAFRLALAPMTNDFVALLKDSSLVSVLTVVELTKQTQIFATNLGSWVVPGALCAALYLAMSLPLARLAGRLEQQWKAPTA
jgi:His/Glu/Gln/Arg/opine family amino acid ABC transporter permease subunit